MQIPDHIISALLPRLRRIADHALCSPLDTRTANALRLLRADIARLEKLRAKSKQICSKPESERNIHNSNI